MVKMTKQQRMERLIRIIDLCASEFELIYPNPTDEQEEWAERFDRCLKDLEEAYQRDTAPANPIEPIDTPDDSEYLLPIICRVSNHAEVIRGSGFFYLERDPEHNHNFRIEIAPAVGSAQEYFERYWYSNRTFRLRSGLGEYIEFRLIGYVECSNEVYRAYIELTTDFSILYDYPYMINVVNTTSTTADDDLERVLHQWADSIVEVIGR